jgi:hypothetical protein
MSKTALDAELVFDRFLGNTSVLSVLASALRRNAPKWFAGLHVRQSPKDRVQVDVRDPAGISKAVLEAAGERGPTYHALVSKFGKGDERLFGSVELRGSTPDLVIVIGVDEKPLSRLAGRLLMGNHITVQVRKSKVEEHDAAAWLSELFMELCQETSPAWGSARDDREYWTKVMTDSPAVSAVGRDFGKYLPGLFWMNFFGKPYVELIGKSRLAGVPSSSTQEIDEGVCLKMYEDPFKWSEPLNRKSEEKALRHIGLQYFFQRENQAQEAVSPWTTETSRH